MYYNDRFDPNSENDSDKNSVNKQKDKDLRDGDKYYFKYTRPVNKTWTDGRHYKKVSIQLFGCGDMGYKIRNAVTGHRYPQNFIVGSEYEDLLFTVSECSGINRHKEPIHLYYDSPEQYENHQFIILDERIKKKWHAKNLEAKRKYNLI